MARASDKDLLQLFDELPDSSEWDNPKLRWSRDLSRAGGSIQLAREFGELAKQAPSRVANLITRLQPRHDERYAGEALQGLTDTDFPAVNLIDMIEELDQPRSMRAGTQGRSSLPLPVPSHRFEIRDNNIFQTEREIYSLC